MENRIANWIVTAVSVSYIAGIMLFALIWLIIAISSGDFGILTSSTTHKWFFWGGLYLLSLYLIGTLKGKNISRRVTSWVFSILFHLSLLAYISLALDAGVAAFVVGMPEAVITFLSCIGLWFCLRSHYKNKA